MDESTDAHQLKGKTMVSSDGHRVGTISEIYDDPATRRAEWVTVSTGLFGHRTSFVPLGGAEIEGDDIRAQVTRDQIRDAPNVADDDDLTEQEERGLFEHYRVPYRVARAASGSRAARDSASSGAVDADDRGSLAHTREADDPGDVPADSATRGTERHPTTDAAQPAGGRRRLRRYIVTEVTTTVPVSEEETGIEPGPTDHTGR